MKIYQSGTIKNGKLDLPGQQFLDKISTLPDGEAIIVVQWINPEKTAAEYKKEYGAKRDLLCREHGYARKDMDHEINVHVLSKILQDPENRLFDEYSISKKELSLIGWAKFIDSLRLWAWSELNCYL